MQSKKITTNIRPKIAVRFITYPRQPCIKKLNLTNFCTFEFKTFDFSYKNYFPSSRTSTAPVVPALKELLTLIKLSSSFLLSLFLNLFMNKTKYLKGIPHSLTSLASWQNAWCIVH